VALDWNVSHLQSGWLWRTGIPLGCLLTPFQDTFRPTDTMQSASFTFAPNLRRKIFGWLEHLDNFGWDSAESEKFGAAADGGS